MPHLFSQSREMAVRGTLPFLKNEYRFVILETNCNNYESEIVKCNNVFVALQLQEWEQRKVLVFVVSSLQKVMETNNIVTVMALQNKNW